MKEVLPTITHVYWLLGATIYFGVLTTLRLFLWYFVWKPDLPGALG